MSQPTPCTKQTHTETQWSLLVAGNAGKKISVAVSDDFSITMTESEMSKDLEDAAAATESLYAQLTAVGGGKADGGSASSSISITDSSGASGEKVAVAVLYALSSVGYTPRVTMHGSV